jgi:hypothetical protein
VAERRTPEPTRRERDRALAYLVAEMPPGALEEIASRAARREWPTLHFGLRLVVRDLLRRGGLGWDDLYIDDHWLELALEAAWLAVEGTGD